MKLSVITLLPSWIKKNYYLDVIAMVICALFSLAAILVSFNRFWQYDVFYYDFGIFDSAIWNVSRFRAPVIDHLVVGGKLIFADHFSPSLFLLSPFYWIIDRSEMLLFIQAVSVGLSGFVLYSIGCTVLKNKLQALSILVCYFLFVGLQNAILFDFHEVTVMSLPLMLTFWAIVNKKLPLYIIFFLITLGFKESTFFLGVGIAIVVFFLRKEWRKIAVASAVLSLMWGLFSIKVVIPYFSGGGYQYSPDLRDGSFGLLTGFFNYPIKRETLFYSFLSFSFLSIFSPMFWLVLLQDFALRFLPYAPARWGLGVHYSIQTAQLLAISSIYGMKNIKKINFFSSHSVLFCVCIVANAIFLYRFILHGPLALAYNPAFYQNTKNFVFLDNLIKRVPKDVSVMTQNNLASHLTHQKVFLLRNGYQDFKPDYIIMDVRSGQNANDFFGTVEVNQTLKRLIDDSRYTVVYNTKDQYIFKKNVAY